MKSFLEEYGFAILAAIVIILLIAMASPLGDIIRTQLSNIVNKFANSANKKLDAADAGDATAILAGQSLTIFANSATDTFKGYLHGVSNGKPVIYKLGDTTATAVAEGEGQMATLNASAANPVVDEVYDKLDEGSEYYVEVMDNGTKTHFFSNRVVKKTA